MNKKLIKEMTREIENLRTTTISLAAHNKEIAKLKRDKENITTALSNANRALEKACEALRENCGNNGGCKDSHCESCCPETFRQEVKNETI